MTSGVYSIYCTSSKRTYYGHSGHIESRIKQHVYALKTKMHTNAYIQKDFDKYGEKSFQYSILCISGSKKRRVSLEKKYIKNHDRKFLYNGALVMYKNPQKDYARKAKRIYLETELYDKIDKYTIKSKQTMEEKIVFVLKWYFG